MEYLKLQTRHLKVIDLKSFNFPPLLSYMDSNRYSDDDPDLSVWFHVPGDRASYYIFSSSDSALWASVLSEVELWNSDPEAYWKSALIEAHQSKMASSLSAMNFCMQDIKASEKALKKLKK